MLFGMHNSSFDVPIGDGGMLKLSTSASRLADLAWIS